MNGRTGYRQLARATGLLLTGATLWLAGCNEGSLNEPDCLISSVQIVGLPAELPALQPLRLFVDVAYSDCVVLQVLWSASPGLSISIDGDVVGETLGGPYTVTATVNGVATTGQTTVVLPPLVPDNRWALAWMHEPATPQYEVDRIFFGYSSAGPIEGIRTSQGNYDVVFHGLAPSAGQRETAHVVAYGPDPRRCRVLGSQTRAPDLIIQVQCQELNGSAADSRFDIVLLPAGSTPGRSGFIVSPPSGGQVAAAGSHNSAQQGLRSERTGTGVYSVVFEGLASGSNSEIVHVTSYGTGNVWCKPAAWSAQGAADLQVIVRCFTPTGVPADGRFSVLVLERGRAGRRFGAVFADQPGSTGPYTPDPARNFNSAGGPNTAQRLQPGVYEVNWPGLARAGGGTAEINLAVAVGTDNTSCQIRQWGLSNSTVICFAPNGTPADSRFTAIWIE